jgi:hypothetical protein
MAQVASPADITAVQNILKTVYVSDNIESQLYDDALLLSQLEKTTEYTDSVGDKAVGFVRVGRNVGVSSRSLNGGTLGAAGHQQANKWQLDYAATYLQVKILGTTIAKMQTARQAAVRVIDDEITHGLVDLKKDLQRQLYKNGDAVISACAVNVGTTTLTLNATDGTDAINRGWLQVGEYIDLGAAGDADSVAAERTISAITLATPSITISGANVTTAVTDYVRRAGNASPVDGTSYEMNGLQNAINDSGTFAGISSSSVPEWKSYVKDAAGAALTRPFMQGAWRNARQYGGAPDFILTSLEQQEAYYNLLQAQVRFAGDSTLGSGKVDGPTFNNIPVAADPDAPRGVMYFLDRSKLFMVTAGEIAWQNTTTGGDILAWKQDEDSFVARAAFYGNLGTNHRRAHSVIKNLNPTP